MSPFSSDLMHWLIAYVFFFCGSLSLIPCCFATIVGSWVMTFSAYSTTILVLLASTGLLLFSPCRTIRFMKDANDSTYQRMFQPIPTLFLNFNLFFTKIVHCGILLLLRTTLSIFHYMSLLTGVIILHRKYQTDITVARGSRISGFQHYCLLNLTW